MAVENLTTWTENDPDSVLTVTSTTVTIASMNATVANPDQVYKDRTLGFYTGDFTHRIGPVNISAASSSNSRMVVIGVGMDIIDDPTAIAGSIAAVWVNAATNPTLSLVEYSDTNQGTVPDSATTIATYQDAHVAIAANFWCELSRTGTSAALKIYSDAFTTLLQTLSFTLTQSLHYQFVFAAGKGQFGSGATVSATVQNVDLAPSSGTPIAVLASSYFQNLN